MLVIVDLAASSETFPLEVLKHVDSILVAVGFRKEISTVIRPGKQYSVTYDGPSMGKDRVEELLRPVAERNNIAFSVEVEESVKFP